VIFPTLIVLGSEEVALERLLLLNPFSVSLAAIPVLFGAFGFHNVIPSLSSYLQQEKKVLRGAVIFGTFLALLLYVIWQWLVLGTLSPAVLEGVRERGLPVTYALAEASSFKVFALGQVFAFLALTTSFLGVSFSLVDFIKDGFEQQGKRSFSRFFYVFLALFPPLLCVWINPHLFDRALGIAGGFGETLLNGVLPVLLFLKVQALRKTELKKRHKTFLGALLFFCVWVIFIEVSHLL
jgi:tyrosine-specific transport protein